jgi:hypothetical protein
MEPGGRIRDSEDYRTEFPCGCLVTFLGSTFHRSFDLSACYRHADPAQADTRDLIIGTARARLFLAKMRQDAY